MSLMVYQTQPALLAGMFIVRDILPCVLWNLNQLWLRLTPVLSDWRYMCGIVFENVRNWCLFHYKNLVRPVRPYHWGTLTQLPVTHLLHNASGWQVPGQVALSGNHSVNCKHCAKYPWLRSVIQQIYCWLPFRNANGCWCGILNA